MTARLFGFGAVLAGIVLMAFAASDADGQIFRRKSQPAMPSVSAPPAQGIFDGTIRKKIVIDLLKHRTIARAQKDGFKLIGGKATPLTKAEAEALMAKVSDEAIAQGIAEASPKTWAKIGEGGFLANLIEWISTHQDEIMAVIKFIMTIMALFADDKVAIANPAGDWFAFDPGAGFLLAF